MGEIIKNWNDGGSLSVAYTGEGDGTAVFSSSQNDGAAREVEVSFVDASHRVVVVRRVVQAAGQASVETYTRLTFIEATGQQYFDLGYIVKEDDIIEMDYISTSTASKDKMLFGAVGTGSVWFSVYASVAYARFGHSSSTTIQNVQKRYCIKLQKGKATLGDTATTLTYTDMPDNTLFIFTNHLSSGNASSAYAYCKTTYFKITGSDGNVKYNLRPVKRDSDGKIGMLDLVSGTFFINEGEGDDFIGGAEIKVADGYELMDYVTFNADKTFGAGIFDSSYTLEAKFERTNTSSAKYLYGVITSPHTATVTAYLASSGSWRWGDKSFTINANDTETHVISLANGTLKYDTDNKTFTKVDFTTPDILRVGGYTSAAGAGYKSFIGKIYYFRIYDGDAPILNWFPCKRISDGVEGFWDCVTQTFVEPM